MLHPSYTDLMQIVNEEAEGDTPVVNSRYSIVMATAKRARQIIADQDLDSRFRAKPLSEAVRELSNGTLHILPEEPSDLDEKLPEFSSGEKFAFADLSDHDGGEEASSAEDDSEDTEDGEKEEDDAE